jgi:hypothetical protein
METSRTLYRSVRSWSLCTALISLVLFSGCVASYKGSPPPPQATTLGQELIDLKRALDEGAITDEEYAEQRTRMLGSEASVADIRVDAS